MYSNTKKYMHQMIESKVTPGISYAFYSKDKVERGYMGNKQILPCKESIDEKTSYDMASLTKVILTNTLVLQLLEEKIIDLDQPFSKYLPEWHEDSVTLRHLLTHTSGINPFIKNRDELDASELRRELLKLPVEMDEFGNTKKYTDTGSLLIGFMLESIFDKNLHDLFSEKVLLVIGMTGSSLAKANSNIAAPTELTKVRGQIKGDVHDPKAFVLGEHCGSAGLFSTLSDTCLFTEMMLNKGAINNNERIVSEDTVNLLLKDWTPSGVDGRSLGWDLLYHLEGNHPILYHTGYTGTFLIIDIYEEEAFIFLSNRVHPYDDKEVYLKARDELINIYQKEKTKR